MSASSSSWQLSGPVGRRLRVPFPVTGVPGAVMLTDEVRDPSAVADSQCWVSRTVNVGPASRAAAEGMPVVGRAKVASTLKASSCCVMCTSALWAPMCSAPR